MTNNNAIDLLNRLEQGMKIEEFEIIERIAHTAHSFVFTVNAENSKIPLVLKLYAGDLDFTAGKDQFSKEARILEILPQHPNLVYLLRTGEFEQRPFLIMQQCSQNLAELVSKSQQTLRSDLCFSIIKDILHGLDCLHSNGVLHLDIKPQNILLNEQCKAVISDFGSACILPSGRLHQVIKHDFAESKISGLTVEYTSPDLIALAQQQKNILDLFVKKPNKAHCLQWDLYSVGAVFYRLLMGKPPADVIEKSSRLDAYTLIKKELGGLVSNPTIHLICDLLGLTEKREFSSARECLAALDDCMNKPEDYPTVCVDDVFQTQPLSKLEIQIDQTLREYGHIPASQIDYLNSLQSIETKSASQKSSNKASFPSTGDNINHALTVLVQERKDYLCQQEGLDVWFNWAEHLVHLHADKSIHNAHLKSSHIKKIRLSRQHYEGLLEQGHASLNTHIHRADNLLNQYFYHQSKLVRFTFLNIVALSVFIIVLVALALIYQPFSKSDSVETATHKPEQGLTSFTQQPRVPLFDSKRLEERTANKSQRKESVNYKGINNDLNGAIKDVIEDPFNDKQVELIEWQKIDELTDVLIMKHEVSQQLYQFCIDEGACRPSTSKKQFSTLNKAANATDRDRFQPKLPKVNVTWYDVTEHFIPWLSAYLGKNLSLPSLTQWQIIASSNVNQNISKVSHCQDCKNSSKYQFVNSLIPVDAISHDAHGLIHFYGNAQEWLQDCWRNDFKQLDSHNLLNTIERCDQAVVAGGSYLNHQIQLTPLQFDRLLKTASSSNVSFRLIWKLE